MISKILVVHFGHRNKEHTMYRIIKNEPDGWSKAYRVVFGEKHIHFFSWYDSAEYFVKEQCNEEF